MEEKSTDTIKDNKSNQEGNEQEKASFYYTAEKVGITKIDATTNKSVKSIEIEGSVHNVQLSPNGKVIGATVVPETGEHGGNDSGHEVKTAGLALFYDAETDELISQVEVGSHPAHIVFTENMNYALVTNNDDNHVSVIDVATYKVIQNISTGNGPHGFRVAADSKTAYIANMGENTNRTTNQKKWWQPLKWAKVPMRL
ncbi:YncE family protein [Bacillus coreaensis]